MSTTRSGPPNPKAAIAAYGKLFLSEAVSVFVLSLLFLFSLMPILTVGASIISLIDTFYASVSNTGSGGGLPPTTSARASNFVASIWEYLRVGLAFGAVFFLVAVSLITYFFTALESPTIASFAFGVVGVYAIVTLIVVLLRAANIIVHANDDDDTDRPGFVAAVRLGYRSITGNVAFESVHIVLATGLVFLAFLIPLGAGMFLFPSSIVLLEVVFYEELDGVGAKTLLYALADPQS